ncbi:AI-2E family transporter, partial [Paracoccus sp. (in: a-proteobacteria)]
MVGPQGHNFPRTGREDGVTRVLVNWAVIGIFLIMAFGAVAAARDFLMPVTMAILLFFVFTPLRRFNERRGIPDGATALLVTVSILITVGVIAYAASGPVNRAAARIPTISSQLEYKFQNVRDSMRDLQEAAKKIDDAQNMQEE